MSPVNTLCLFSAALCNIAVIDQGLFEQQGSQPAVNGGINNQGVNFVVINQGQNSPQQNQAWTPHSPCGKKFQYVTDGRQWKGILRVKNIDVHHDIDLKVDFVLPQGLHKKSYQGKISLINQPETLYEELSRGMPLLLEVSFASQNPVPKLTAIHKNKREICGAQPLESTNGYASMRLKYHFVKIPDTAPYITHSEDRFNVEATPTAPLPQPPVKPVQNGNQYQDDSTVCGVPVAGFTQSLVIGGQAAGRGEWPWLVAFYRSSSGNLEFICGGSLISSTYTITAAHCVQDKGRQEPMQSQNALLFIGKHNLIQWNEEGFEKRGVKTFKVHPEWNPNDVKYDADLALIEMDSPVSYSKFIRPICLWSGSSELAQVVGQNGIVAGWGKNDAGLLNTDFPKKVNVPIVSDGQCLRTHEAFVHITSERTFCAGGRMGEGPCQGDSGGGLVLKVGRKWFVRGIVSASLRDGASCDVNSFAVFTDIAKFTPWIKSQM